MPRTIATIVTKSTLLRTQATENVFLPPIRQSLLRLTDALLRLSDAPFSTSEEKQQAEEDLIRSFDAELLISLRAAPADVWGLLADMLTRKFADSEELIKVPPAGPSNPQPRPWRVSHAILARLQSIDPEAISTAEMQAFTERLESHRPPASEAVSGGSSNPQGIAQSGNNSSEPTSVTVTQAPESKETRLARIKRTVKSEFDGDTDTETAKFSGDLSVAPSFDLFEKRFRHVISPFSSVLSESEKVSMLGDALEGPALVYFLDNIETTSTRSGSSLDDRNLGSASQELRPSARTMSAAFKMLDDQFCSHQARLALRQKLVSLRMKQVQAELKLTKPDALRLLQRRIERLSANGPHAYCDEVHRIDALRTCLDGEAWAIDTFAACEQNPDIKTLQQYIDNLASYCQTRDMIAPAMGSDQVRPQPSEILYGEARSSPRTPSRGRFGNSPYQRRSMYRGKQPMSPFNNRDARSQARAAGLPRGDDLKKMLKNIICWRCGEAGHYSSKCPKPRRSFQESSAAFVSEGHGTTEEALFWLSAQFDEAVDVCHAEEEPLSRADELRPEEADTEEEEIMAMDSLFASFASKPDAQDFH